MTAYKESGIKWLGKIPTHWEVMKLKYVCSSSGSNLTLKEIYEEQDKKEYPVFGASGIVGSLGTYQQEKECIGIVKDGAGVGRVFLLPKYSSILATLNYLHHCDSFLNINFFYYLLNTINFMDFVQNSTIPHIYFKDYSELFITLPPLEEQEKIANFLDKKLEKIDYFIAKQTKFIELLKEQKQVLINQATTKGLDKSTKLKDTHISHLGKIPTHWEVIQLKRIATTNIGLIFSPSNISDDKNGTPVLRSNNINNGEINYSDLLYVSGLDIEKTNIANSGDLIMCVRNGSPNLVGKTAVVTKDGYAFGAFMAVIKSKYNNFLYWVFQTDMLRKSTYSFAASSGISQITQADIKNFTIALPPLEEQEKIAKYLDDKCEKIDKAINNITKQISLIQEYKTSLIDTTTKGMLKELK